MEFVQQVMVEAKEVGKTSHISRSSRCDSYKLSLLMDNSKQIHMMKLQQEAKSKSIGLSKQAAPSIFSLVHQTVHKHGTYIYATLSFNFILIPIQTKLS
jgi:hypothetical protein